MILCVSLESVIIFPFLINLPSLELLCLCVCYGWQNTTFLWRCGGSSVYPVSLTFRTCLFWLFSRDHSAAWGGAHSAVPGPARLKGLSVLPTLMLIPSGQQTFLDRVISRVGISNLWLFLNTVTRSLLAAGPQAENRHMGVCFDSSCCRQTGFLSQRKQYTNGFKIWIPPSCYLFICSWLVTALPTLWIVTS